MILRLSIIITLVLCYGPRLVSQEVDLTGRDILYGSLEAFEKSTPSKQGVSIECLDEAKKKVYLRIEAYAPDMARLRMSREPITERPNYTLAKTTWDSLTCQIETVEGTIRLRTGELEIVINKSPLRFIFYDSHGNVLVREHGPFGLGTGADSNRTMLRETFAISSWRDEAFFGLGEKFGRLDKKGSIVRIWNKDSFLSRNDHTSINVPFFMNTQGYGIFVNSFGEIIFRFGTESNEYYTIEAEDKVLDYFFIVGPGFKKIIERYTELTGRAPLPPRWAFGVWFSRDSYGSQQAVEEVCQKMRDFHLPCDVINIDHNYWATGYNDFRWNSNFPKPAEMITKIKGMGFKISLWETPFVNDSTYDNRLPVVNSRSMYYDEGTARGYFLKRPDGSVYNIKWWWGSGALVDFTNPDASAWWWRLHVPLVGMGIDVFKTDDGEFVPRDAVFSNGMTGVQMHNLYGLLYNKTIFEGIQEATKERGITWGRSGYAGSQRFSIVWAGDQASTFEYLPTVIRAGQSIGLSGIPMWSHDIGGYNGTPSKECFIRWIQLGMLSPFARVHGNGEREPWKFGKDVLEIYKRYAELRMQLFPYLYSYAYVSHVTGLPIMRAMVLEHQDDLVSRTMDLQYFLGEEFLVAPIYSQFNRRTVYIPEGTWIDYWTGKSFTGPQVMAVTAPLDQIPLFVRAGAIIPMAPVMNHIDENPITELTLDVYPADKSSFKLYEDTGTTVFSCSSNAKTVLVTLPPLERSYFVKINGQSSPWQISLEDQIIPKDSTLKEFEKDSVGWYFFEGGKNYTGIKIPSGMITDTVTVTLEQK